MSRIPYVRRDELGPEGQQLWDSIVILVNDQAASTPGLLRQLLPAALES